MNPLVVAAVVGALLLPVPPLVPAAGQAPGLARVAAADHRSADSGPGPTRPVAVWPLDPRPMVVAGFFPPSSPWSSGHRGVDLLGHAGASVRSTLAGTVSFAGTIAGRGVVVVDHGSFETTYEPVEVSVHAGARLGAGETIGTLQARLSHCAPRVCLHWGLVQDNAYRDPLTLLNRARVRLLPLVPQARGWARW